MKRFPPKHRSLLAVLLLVLAWLVYLPGGMAAEPLPEETRPYLELPFPGGMEYRVSCGYGCYQHKGSMSYAVDFAVPESHPITAAAGGEVIAVTWELGLPAALNLGDALILYIDHGNGWFTRYIHLSGITVTVGDTVQMGDIIGYSGKTGASGAHLHFELRHGTSLYAPSVPIDELFGGQEPRAGVSYISNNLLLGDALLAPPATAAPEEAPVPAPLALIGPEPVPSPDLSTSPIPGLTSDPLSSPSPVPLVTPTEPVAHPEVAQRLAQGLPQLDGVLSLSSPVVRAGEPVTATFTLHNTTSERLHLSMLGVGGQAQGDEFLAKETLFFDRSIVLNPGRTYSFERQHRFTEPGTLELFVFALNPQREWIPLAGGEQRARLLVKPSEPILFLPVLTQNEAVSP